jgi:hypothetical protein
MVRWLAILFAPLVALVALALRFLPGKKTRDRSAEEVAQYLRNFINGEGENWDWDDFESVPITDPELDRIRKEAARAGPPNPDLRILRKLQHEAEQRALATPRQSAT